MRLEDISFPPGRDHFANHMPDSSLNRHHLRSAKEVSRCIGPRIFPRRVLAQETGYQGERLLVGRHRPGPSPRRSGDVEGRGHCDQDSGWTAILHSQDTHCCPQRSGVHHSGTPSRRCPLKCPGSRAAGCMRSWRHRMDAHAPRIATARHRGVAPPSSRGSCAIRCRARPSPRRRNFRGRCAGMRTSAQMTMATLGRMPRSRSQTQIS